MQDRFLPPLLDMDYATADRASQFLTEVQGGSDVGANACQAEPVADGSYLLSGEKWFCSVADAGQFLVTARPVGAPEGTRGLGCFVMPRHLDGEPNGFSIRRLKDKLGTRGTASGEIDVAGARAWPIGPIEEGFKTAAGVVLNTSRWMTAVGCTGLMRLHRSGSLRPTSSNVRSADCRVPDRAHDARHHEDDLAGGATPVLAAHRAGGSDRRRNRN